MHKIDYVRIITDSPKQEHRRVGFVEVYKEAFGGPPYFETYTDADVLNDIWFPHLMKGIIVLALDVERVVGLGCAKPVSEAPQEDQVYLKARQKDESLPGSTDTMWYMSELAILNAYRRKRIGYQLVAERLKYILALKGDRYSFRTASQDSNSAQLYLNIGAVQLCGVVDVSTTNQVKVNESKSKERIFFYGFCHEAIGRIRNMV